MRKEIETLIDDIVADFAKFPNHNGDKRSEKSVQDFRDEISINEQFESVKASVSEDIISDNINLTFKIEETEKFFVERIKDQKT